MDFSEYIETNPEILGGKPVIRGTRVSVEVILESLSSGFSIEETAENFRIPKEAVYAALKYASEVLKRGIIIAAGR